MVGSDRGCWDDVWTKGTVSAFYFEYLDKEMNWDTSHEKFYKSDIFMQLDYNFIILKNSRSKHVYCNHFLPVSYLDMALGHSG